MKRYLITCEKTCPDCEGKKTIKDPYGFWEEYADYQKSTDKPDSPQAFYSNSFPLSNSLPPEEIMCESCDGTGVVRSEVDFGEAMKEYVNAQTNPKKAHKRLEDASQYCQCLSTG